MVNILCRSIQEQQPTHSIAEEFTRMVNEVANQPTSNESAAKSSKNTEVPTASSTLNSQPQTNAITSINSNIGKSEILSNNENKNLGPDIAVEPIETPVVSAISDSPVIVPKMPKQLQKNSEQNVQSLVLDTNKNLPANKQHKTHNKNKPLVPQNEDVDKSTDNSSTIAPQESAIVETVTQVPAAAPAQAAPTPVPVPTPAPQPQRIRENKQRLRSEEKEKLKEREQIEKETPPTCNKPNGPTPPAG